MAKSHVLGCGHLPGLRGVYAGAQWQIVDDVIAPRFPDNVRTIEVRRGMASELVHIQHEIVANVLSVIAAMHSLGGEPATATKECIMN